MAGGYAEGDEDEEEKGSSEGTYLLVKPVDLLGKNVVVKQFVDVPLLGSQKNPVSCQDPDAGPCMADRLHCVLHLIQSSYSYISIPPALDLQQSP